MNISHQIFILDIAIFMNIKFIKTNLAMDSRLQR